MRNWRKLGKTNFCQSLNKDLLTHTSNPLAVYLKDDEYRIFFSARDKSNKSSIGYVDIDILKNEVTNISNKTIFKYGTNDSFYSHGVSVGNLYSVENKDYILFMAWQIKDGQHWRGDIGRLLLKNNEVLSLDPKDAFMTCDGEDKVSLSYPWVIFDEGIYKMWYGSTNDWNSSNGEMIHVIKYATSKDGKNWDKHGLAIPFEIGIAQAFSRPTVIKDNNVYHMWFSYRSGDGTKYRIGYAQSKDSLIWDRKDHSGIEVSKEGWDSEMICYPFVFDHKGKRYMLYNGNDYGKTGFGLAVLEEE